MFEALKVKLPDAVTNSWNSLLQRNASPALVTPKVEPVNVAHFTDRFLARQARQAIFEESFRGFNPVDSGTFLNKGEDCIARIADFEGRTIVSKELLPSSRLYQIFGLGVEPRDMAEHRANPTRESADLDLLADRLRLLQTLVETYVGEDRCVAQTATKVAEGKVYRLQTFIPHPQPSSELEQRIKYGRMLKFYDEVRKRWLEMTFSSDLNNMPRDIQEYCKIFPPDDGVGTNAIFLGLALKPEFILIDY